MASLSIISSTAGLLGAAYAAYKHIKPSAVDDNLNTFRIRKLAGSNEAELDIVFVHGLGTDSESAWVGTGDTGRRHCWPIESLPKELSGTCSARILAYDYDTTYWTQEYLTERTLLAQTSHLIQALASFGHRPLGKPRRIIFVAHGLGGIVVKNALVLAATSGESQLHHVVARTVGLVLLGTPHEGCPGAIARNICGWVQSLGIDLEGREYQELLERTTTLAYALERFKPLARDLFVHTFGQVRRRQGQDNNPSGVAECGPGLSTGSISTRGWGGMAWGSRSQHKRYFTDCDDANLSRFGAAEDRDLRKIMASIRSICFEVKSRKLRLNESALPWKTVQLNAIGNVSWKELRCDLGNMLPLTQALTATDVSGRVVELVRSYFSHLPVSGETPGEFLSTGVGSSHLWWSASTVDGHLRKLDPYIGKWLSSRPLFHAVSDSSRQSPWPVVILSGPQGSGKTRAALRYAHFTEQGEKGYGSKLWVDATDSQSLQTSFVGIAQRIRQRYAEKDAGPVDQLFGLDGLLYKDHLDDRELQTLVGTVTNWLESADGERWLLIIDNLSLTSPYPPRRSFAHRLVWKAASFEIEKNSPARATARRTSAHAAISVSRRDGSSARPAVPVSHTGKKQAWRWKHWRQLIRLIPSVTGAKGHIIITTRDTPDIPGPRIFSMEDTTSDDPLASISVGAPSDAEVARVCERQREYPAARLLYKRELHSLAQGNAHLDTSDGALLSLQLDHARTYQAEGRYTEAGAEYEDILQQKLVEGQPEKRLSTIRQLAIVRAEQGELDEAIKQASQGLGLEDPFGDDGDNLQVLELIYELSRYLFTAGHPQAASSLLERLVMSLEHVHGLVHPMVLAARDDLAQALMSTGNMEPASKQLEWLCKCRSQLLGEDHPVTLLSRAKFGLLLNRRGLVNDALDTLTRCLTAAERTLAASHPLVFRVRETLYWVLRTQGKDKLAQVQLEELRREVTDHAGLYSKWIKSAYSEKTSGRDSVTNAAWMNRSRSTWMLDRGEDETDDELDF